MTDHTKRRLLRKQAELKTNQVKHAGTGKSFFPQDHQTEQILDALAEHVVYHDMDMKVLWANRAACQSVMLELGQVVGRHCYEIWSNRSVPCDDCPVKLSHRTGLPQAVEKTTPDGRSWHIGASPVTDAKGNIVAMVELTMDISERVQMEMALRKIQDEQEQRIDARTADLMSVNKKLNTDITRRRQAEGQLRESEERFRKVFENAVMGIAIKDWKGRLLQCNPAYCNLLGYTDEELHRMAFDSLIHPQDREAYLAEIHRLQSGEFTFFDIKNRYVRKDGRPVWVHKFVSILHAAMDQPANLMILVNDITDQIQAKDQLSRLNDTLVERTHLAEQRAVYIQQLAMELSKAEDRERQRLASVLHDDLQQMLAYLKIKLTSPQARADRGENISRTSLLIDQCIDRCRNLAHELKPFGPRRNDFLGALKSTCRQMNEMYGLAVALRVSTDPGVESPVLSSLLIRSIRELLFNVTKHSGANGASIDLRVDGNQMLVTIKDEGSGCDMGTLREKRENNAAFGLFDIEDRVSFLGGSMHIESVPGEGFCVTLWVPRELSCPSDRKPPPAVANRAGVFKTVVQPLEPVDPGAGRSISVLLADDHPIMREGLAELINGHAGMAVVGLAANGQEAVDLAAKLRPDVVLMDVSMPLMNGIEAARQISLLLPGIRIIGLTMHKDPDIRQAMRNAGACACLSKADDLKKLIETLSQAYNKF